MRRAVALALALAGCKPDPSLTLHPHTAFGAELPGEASEAYARWTVCAHRLSPRGARHVSIEPKVPEDGFATVVGSRVLYPLNDYRATPRERHVGLLAHELGHVWGILDLDTGKEPALMSRTTSSQVPTPLDCAAFCSLWRC